MALLVLSQLPAPNAIAAPKTDVVVLLNGDRLTGEVKELEHGKLSFKTDATDTISIQWDKVQSLQSKQYMQVEMATGLRHFGNVGPASQAGQLAISDATRPTTVDVPLVEVVSILPIDRGNLIARLDGYMTAGYNYTKANSLQQFTFTGGLSSIVPDHRWSIDAASTVTTQESASDAQRSDATGLYRWSLASDGSGRVSPGCRAMTNWGWTCAATWALHSEDTWCRPIIANGQPTQVWG